MKSDLKWPEGQVLLLYNIDPLWGKDENDNVLAIVRQIKTELEQEGHSVALLGAEGPDIGNILMSYNPAKHVVLKTPINTTEISASINAD